MQPGPIATAWIVTAALLLAEHFGMWSQPWRLDPPWNYLLGVLTLMVGWCVWGMLADGPVTPIDAVANIGAVSTAGAVIMACYWWRGRLDRAKKQTAVVTKARSLTQDIIDGGPSHAAGKPSIHDRSRNN